MPSYTYKNTVEDRKVQEILKGSQLLFVFHPTWSLPKDFCPICIRAVASQKANGLYVVHVNWNLIYLKTVGLGDIDNKEEFSPRAGTAQDLVLL